MDSSTRKLFQTQLKLNAYDWHIPLHYSNVLTFMRELFRIYQKDAKLSRYTLFLAVAIFTDFWTNNVVFQTQLLPTTVQIHAVAAMWIASKYEDKHCLEAWELVSRNKTKKLISAEAAILKHINFQLCHIVTPEHYRCATVVICKNLGIGTCVDSRSARLLDSIFDQRYLFEKFHVGCIGFCVVFILLNLEQQQVLITYLTFVPQHLYRIMCLLDSLVDIDAITKFINS